MAGEQSRADVVAGEVFISYSWDNENHVRSVLELSNRLRFEGVDCVLDQYEESPPEGWPRWMDRKIRDSRLVLMICTETYYKRVMGDDVPNKASGVRWEGGLIYQHLYNAGSNEKFIPVLFRDEDKKFIPTPLQSATHYNIQTQAQYDRLYARLLNRPGVKKPDLGTVRPLLRKQVKTNLSMYVTGPIDVELWDEAKWRSTAVLVYPDRPPVLGLGFLNEEPARKIFEKWHERYGHSDDFEELRVSIIEGDIEGEAPGYTVHLGADFENTIKRYKSAGLAVNRSNAMFMMIGRMCRMNPAPTSKNLQVFKDAYRLHKTYLLIPAVQKPDGSAFKPILELGIFKNTVHFRNVDEIHPPHDPDVAVLGTGQVTRPKTRYGRRSKHR
jgi:SEFIR domain